MTWGGGAQAPRPTLPVKMGITDVETLLQNLLPVGPAPVPPTQPSTLRRIGLRCCVSRVVNHVMARRDVRH